jgi:leucyl/phenylalanyl-tRNA--protein transferase
MFQNQHVREFARLFSDGVEPEAPASPAQRRRQRMETFRESPGRRFARLCADLNHALSPRALLGLPGAIDFLIREKGIGVAGLPDARYARTVPDGLAGLANDLSPASIAEAYGRGLFLRWMMGTPTYWSPAQRMVAHPGAVTANRDCEGLLHGRNYRVTLDRDFDAVVKGATKCALKRRAPYSPNSKGMLDFAALHDAGFAHSVEIRNRSGVLCGGLYGIACGRVFVVQARFGKTQAIADLAMVALAKHLEDWGFDAIDGCYDENLARLGFSGVAREDYLANLPASITGGRPGRWLVVPGLLQ